MGFRFILGVALIGMFSYLLLSKWLSLSTSLLSSLRLAPPFTEETRTVNNYTALNILFVSNFLGFAFSTASHP